MSEQGVNHSQHTNTHNAKLKNVRSTPRTPHLQMQIEAVKPQERWAFHAVGVELGSGSSAQAAVQVHGKVGQGGT